MKQILNLYLLLMYMPVKFKDTEIKKIDGLEQ